MDVFTIQPSLKLAGIVSYFWVSRCNHTPEEAYTYYSTAETYAKLVFMYKTDATGALQNGGEYYSTLQGQTETHGQFPTLDTFEMFGVCLHPNAVLQIFGFSASDIKNQMVDLPLLLGTQGKELDEKMAAADSTDKRLSIITHFLLIQLSSRYKKETLISSAIRNIRMNRGVVDISALASDYFLSHKQFKRKFIEESGFTPKLFARIVRFETALWQHQQFSSLTELAYACGYYDQSHFIHDFKAFSGYTPKQYFALTGI